MICDQLGAEPRRFVWLVSKKTERLVSLEAKMTERFVQLESKMTERFVSLESEMTERFGKKNQEFSDNTKKQGLKILFVQHLDEKHNKINFACIFAFFLPLCFFLVSRSVPEAIPHQKLYIP